MLKKAIFASAMLAAAAGAQAQTANFNVTGTVTPPSCTLTLGATSLDFGANTAAAVRAMAVQAGTVAHYYMGTKSTTWSVACTAVMPVQLAFADNRAGKILAMDSNDGNRFGLVNGASGTTSIGSYSISFNGVSATFLDGASVSGFLHATSSTAGATWSANAVGTAATQLTAPGKATGFIKSAGQTTPSSFTNANGTLVIGAHVGKALVDAMTSTITLNGSNTITLQYL